MDTLEDLQPSKGEDPLRAWDLTWLSISMYPSRKVNSQGDVRTETKTGIDVGHHCEWSPQLDGDVPPLLSLLSF